MISLPLLLHNYVEWGFSKIRLPMSRTFFASWLRRTAMSPADHCLGLVMSILMAPDRTSLRIVLKCVVLPLPSSDEEAFSPDVGALSLGTGGAGTVVASESVDTMVVKRNLKQKHQAHILEAHLCGFFPALGFGENRLELWLLCRVDQGIVPHAERNFV